MFRNMIKTLWNSRRSYRMLIIEQLSVFVVLAICFMSLFDMLGRYRDPGLLNTDNTVLFSMMIRPGTMQDAVTGNQEYIKIGNEATSKIATIVHQKR